MVEVDGNGVLHSSVLVLNRSYVAVRVVNVRRAFVMLYRDAAEVIHIDNGSYANYDFGSWCEWSMFASENCEQQGQNDDADWIRTVRFRIQIPRVIRLLRFDHLPRQQVRLNRKNVFARDAHCCQYCGNDFPPSQLSFDHVTPRSRGGATDWENVVTCCLVCNSRKGDRTPQEAGMELRRRPLRPMHNPMLKIKLGNPRYHVWRPFLNQSGSAIDVV
jgi:5-methylcytosine-specific restriction endonuclease McrA